MLDIREDAAYTKCVVYYKALTFDITRSEIPLTLDTTLASPEDPTISWVQLDHHFGVLSSVAEVSGTRQSEL